MNTIQHSLLQRGMQRKPAASSAPTLKIKFAQTSSEVLAGNMAITEVMEMMSKKLDDKLKNLSTKDDLERMETKLETLTIPIEEISRDNIILKEKIRVLEEEKRRIEEHMKRKNIVIRGINPGKSIYEAIDLLVKEKLQINNRVEFENI